MIPCTKGFPVGYLLLWPTVTDLKAAGVLMDDRPRHAFITVLKTLPRNTERTDCLLIQLVNLTQMGDYSL